MPRENSIKNAKSHMKGGDVYRYQLNSLRTSDLCSVIPVADFYTSADGRKLCKRVALKFARMGKSNYFKGEVK